jgi:hypothetical protein
MESLLKAALIGTAKHAGLPFQAGDETDGLLQSLSDTNKESMLLHHAGVRSLYKQCGRSARTGIPPLETFSGDEKCVRSPRVIELIRECLTPDRKELLVEFLRALADAKLMLAPELLPSALEQSDPSMREALLPVIGARGEWLGRFNPRWSWALEGTKHGDLLELRRMWDEGIIQQRGTALAALRRTDAAEGRRWLQESLPQEKAEDRARLVMQLETELSMADEPLLEKLLDDKSEHVRQGAVSLLCRLNESQLSQRMRIRGAELLQAEKAGILRKALRLRCKPPEELDRAWIRDGIPARVPIARSKRGFWAEKLVSAIPLKYWNELFQTDARTLMQAIEQDEYAEEVIRGWTKALQLSSPADPSTTAWAKVLWEYLMKRVTKAKQVLPEGEMSGVLAILKVMPDEDVELAILPFVSNSTLLPFLLGELKRPWPTAFSNVILKQARSVTKSSPIDQAFEWTKCLLIAALALSQSSLRSALLPWDLNRPGETSWTYGAMVQQVERFLAMIRLRANFYAELAKDQVS